jgi:hypothetical protein
VTGLPERSGRGPADRPVTEDDVAVSLGVARDLGPGNEAAVVTEFLDRVGPAIDARVDARVGARVDARVGARAARGQGEPSARTGQPALAFVSVLAGIPITAVSLGITDGGVDGVVATAVAWAGLAAVNAATSLRRR